MKISLENSKKADFNKKTRNRQADMTQPKAIFSSKETNSREMKMYKKCFSRFFEKKRNVYGS